MKRLLLPAVVCSYTVNPLTRMLPYFIAGIEDKSSSSLSGVRRYLIWLFPHPGVEWYLYWLFFFCVVFCNIANSSNDPHHKKESESLSSHVEFLRTKTRFFYGSFILGVGGILIKFSTVTTMFFGMPINVASFLTYFFMFRIGVTAHQQEWFDKSLADQIDVPARYLYIFASVEGCLLTAVSYSIEATRTVHFMLRLSIFILAGIFCVDMNLALLVFFQRKLDFATLMTKKLAKASYTVYLVHPLVVTALSSVYIKCYNSFVTLNGDSEYPDIKDMSDSGLITGFLSVAILSNLILWPLASWISNQSAMKNIL